MTKAMAIWLLNQLYSVVGSEYKQAISIAIDSIGVQENDKRVFNGEKRDCDHISTDF